MLEERHLRATDAAAHCVPEWARVRILARHRVLANPHTAFEHFRCMLTGSLLAHSSGTAGLLGKARSACPFYAKKIVCVLIHSLSTLSLKSANTVVFSRSNCQSLGCVLLSLPLTVFLGTVVTRPVDTAW